jgi:hypothetical protein
MALELKHLSQQSQDNDEQWNNFCNTHVKKAEEKWTKKLEDYDYLPEDDSQKSDDEEE